MSPERFALEASVYASPSIGEPVSQELVKAVASLVFFAAQICDVEPERLRLGHLVGHVTRPRAYSPDAHPMRRQSDRRPEATS